MSLVEPVVFLKGRRVSLRPIEKGDMVSCARWINDPDVRDFVKNFWPMTQKEEDDWYENLGKTKPGNLILAMVTNEGEYIGNMGIHRIDWRGRVGTTGALIGEKKYWGKGLGTEAKILLLNHAFESMNLRKICSQVIEYNERSRRYSEKCGYKLEGVLKEHVFRRGRYWDLLNLAVFKPDFDPIWEKYRESLQDHA